MVSNEILKNFPFDYLDFPNGGNEGHIPIANFVGGKMYKLTLVRLANLLGIVSVGATPIFFTGNVLPSLNNSGQALKKGDWTILMQGQYQNIAGGPDVLVPDGYIGISMFDGVKWVLVGSQSSTASAIGKISLGDFRPISGDTIFKK